MSQKDDSEDDIWEYKPLIKKKRTQESSSATSRSQKTPKRPYCSPVKSSARDVNLTEGVYRCVPYTSVNNPGTSGSIDKGHVPYTSSPEPAGDGATESDFCPICQIPFSILVVQPQILHVTECLDTPRNDVLECPDGLQCSSTIPNHYKRYNHTLLAHSRAANDSVLFSLSQAGETTARMGVCSTSDLESSQDSATNSSSLPNHHGHLASTPTRLTSSLPNYHAPQVGGHLASIPTRLTSSLSNHNTSPVGGHLASTPTPMKNSLLLLRSPRPEDLKKKKGWMTPRGPKTKVAVENMNPTVSSRPCNVIRKPGSQGGEKPPDKPERSPYNADLISFSPLSELPAEQELEEEVEVEVSGFRKALFPPSLAEKNQEESEDSLELFSDDELLNDFLNHLETDLMPKQKAEPASLPVSSTRVEAVCSLAAPSNQPACTAAVDNSLGSTHREAGGNPAAAAVQSPQSVVLERLRQTLTISNSLYCQSVNYKNNPMLGSSQTANPTSTQAMAPQQPALSQCKAGQVASLKQTDIGVFFGLKPLKDQQGEPGSGSQEPKASTTAATYSGGGSRRGRQKQGEKSKAAAPRGAGTSSTDGGGPSGGQVGTQREGARGWRKTGRARWNRGGADGDSTRRCPFYKKIPGTGFAIDAFSYGEIEGISSYFLTHFHSDHYEGLTKKSTARIYCNKITGNLVRSKLKVEERYLHILPMNTRVMVDGAEVILMEANHCPGAAMLLFFLPDGQIVLHTGDFRADPKMESYPELLGCRVQTLYLDTTYCSPEYTFPSQQEAISFAANTAFELVALHPRTLVVCGSYSVGKEKVFLALAEVLGSNVCLSRDKYNTMCCLESEPIRKLLTTDWKAAKVHVLPMMHLNVKKLQAHLNRFSTQYDRLVAFKPTGWTFSQQMDSMDNIQPQISGNITLYGIPYSEHSSFLEMKRFVQWLRPLKIIPTVSAGSWDTRKAMERCFKEWLTEAKANR
ncbi:unnamed protein product [Merluccius merluccius]